jgi:hypothetical protein
MVITTLVSQLLVAVPSIIVGTQALTSTVNGLFKIDTAWVRHLISWVIAVLIGLGFIATGGLSFGLPYVWAEYVAGGVAGLLAGGAANGFYDWDAIKSIFDAWEAIIRGGAKKEKADA